MDKTTFWMQLWSSSGCVLWHVCFYSCVYVSIFSMCLWVNVVCILGFVYARWCVLVCYHVFGCICSCNRTIITCSGSSSFCWMWKACNSHCSCSHIQGAETSWPSTEGWETQDIDRVHVRQTVLHIIACRNEHVEGDEEVDGEESREPDSILSGSHSEHDSIVQSCGQSHGLPTAWDWGDGN